MEKFYSFMPKRILILIFSLLLGVTVLTLTVLLRSPQKTSTFLPPVISQSPSPVIHLQKTIIGKTTAEEVEKNNPIQNRQILANGDLQYSIRTELENRPDQIIISNNKALFERIVILGNSSELGKIKLSEQIIKYGPAEKIIRGSKFYGFNMDTYIYPGKGLAFITNTFTDQIEEIQVFVPTTLEAYLAIYGEDINENTGIREEFGND